MARKGYLEAVFVAGVLAWTSNVTAQDAGARDLRPDRVFLNDALGVNELERRLGTMAMDRAVTAEVRTAAAKMVEKHTALGQQLSDLSRQAGGSGEPQLTRDQRATLDAMASQPAAVFDREFKKTVDEGHVKELAMYQAEVDRAVSPALRDLAKERVVALQKSLAGVSQPVKAAEGSGSAAHPVNAAEGTGSRSGW